MRTRLLHKGRGLFKPQNVWGKVVIHSLNALVVDANKVSVLVGYRFAGRAVGARIYGVTAAFGLADNV